MKYTRIQTVLTHAIGPVDAMFNKEVFVKHEQAPTAPKLEGVWFFFRF